jgi:hypothetical protein
MVAKSIVEIDLQGDDKFKAFAALYDKYSKTLEKAPGAWAGVSKEVAGQRKGFEAIAAALLAQNEITRREISDSKKVRNNAEETARSWRDTARSTKEFAANIARGVGTLVKWTGIGGIAGGLLGIGGLFGLDRLAGSAANARRTSLGIGTSVAERSAFQVSFGRVVDDSFLSSVNEALHDVTKRHTLYGAGLREDQLQGRSTAQVAVTLLDNLKRLVDQTPSALLAQVLQARGLTQFLSLERAEGLKATPGSEYAGLHPGYAANLRRFAVDPANSLAWQDFVTRMDEAGRSITTVLTNGLVKLESGIEKLSESFEKTVKVLFDNGGPLERWLGELDSGLERFAKFVGTDEFQADVKGLVEGVGKLADVVGRAVDWLTPKRPADDPNQRRIFGDKPLFNGGLLGTIDPKVDRGSFADKFLTFLAPLRQNQLLGMVRRLEGSGDNAVSPAGAIGRYQITPDTARTYDFDPRRLFEPAYNEQAARVILSDLARRYGGNVDEVLAAYNAGPGRANRFRAAGDNPAVLPAETQGYLDRAHKMQGYLTRVEIINNTGGNAVPIVNQLAQ